MGKGKGGKGGAAAATDAGATEVSTRILYCLVPYKYFMCVFDGDEIFPSPRLWFFSTLFIHMLLQSAPHMLRHVRI